MAYVDGFVLPVKKSDVAAYKKGAAKAAALFKEYGALSVVECEADDVPYGTLTSFPRAVQATDDEIVFFSWIVYPSKEVRDASNKRMMEDPRMKEVMDESIIDGKRMTFGGFTPVVDVK